MNWLLYTASTMEQVSCLRLLEIVPKDPLPNTEEQCVITHMTVRAPHSEHHHFSRNICIEILKLQYQSRRFPGMISDLSSVEHKKSENLEISIMPAPIWK